MSELIRVRQCDGQCCRESPRWPNADGTDCIFHNNNQCDLQAGLKPVPETCPVLPDLTGQEAFEFSCVNWPHNSQEGRGTGGCCWQWVDGD